MSAFKLYPNRDATTLDTVRAAALMAAYVGECHMYNHLELARNGVGNSCTFYAHSEELLNLRAGLLAINSPYQVMQEG